MEIISSENNFKLQFEALKTEFRSAQTVFEIKFAQSESVMNTQQQQLLHMEIVVNLIAFRDYRRTIVKKHFPSLKLFLCKKRLSNLA